MEKREVVYQDLVLSDLRSMGKYCECFKIIKTSDDGEPDIFFTTKKTGAILVEMKRPKGPKAKKLQKLKIKKLNDCGTPTFVCHSWEEWIAIKKLIGLNTRNPWL